MMLLLCSLVRVVACTLYPYQPVFTGSFVNGQPQWALTLPHPTTMPVYVSFLATTSGANSKLLTLQSGAITTGSSDLSADFHIVVKPNWISGAHSYNLPYDLDMAFFGYATEGKYWSILVELRIDLLPPAGAPQVFYRECTVYNPAYLSSSSSSVSSSVVSSSSAVLSPSSSVFSSFTSSDVSSSSSVISSSSSEVFSSSSDVSSSSSSYSEVSSS